MKAKAYLSEIRSEYEKIREVREKLGLETNKGKQKELREYMKTMSAYYAGVLNEIWDTIEQLQPGTGRELLLRKYVFLMSFDEIADELGYTVKSLYSHHTKAVRELQKILDGRRIVA